MHYSDKCTYKTYTCKTCKTIGHKDGYCATAARCKANKNASNTDDSSKKKKERRNRKPNSQNPDNRDMSCKKVANISNYAERRKYMTVDINSHKIELQLDTASDTTIISPENWYKLGKPRLQSTSHVARNATGGIIKMMGELECSVVCNNRNRLTKCLVTSERNLNLLGIDWIELFQLWCVPFNTICNTITDSSAEVDGVKQYFQQLFDEK